ncbi:MAG: glycosyltransferase family 39 protein [Acutalibacter sp.]|nr:glycosyltransferase family 39 protein [Acutalibacter sp.]
MIVLTVFPMLLLIGIIFLRCLMVFEITPRISKAIFCPIGDSPTGCQGRSFRTSRVFFGAIGLRLVLLLAAIAAVMIRTNAELSLEECFQQMQHWDAIHYTKLVDLGYSGYMENEQHLFLVFFPGYVWLVRFIRLLVPNTVVTGMAVSSLCYAGGCCFLFKLVEGYYNAEIARDSVIYLSLFPFSLFFGFVMTEGLFLLTTTAACFYAQQKKWLFYGIWGFFAALTRMTGILVIVPALIEIISNRQSEFPLGKRVVSLIRKIPLLLMPILGSGIYLLLNAVIDGNPMAFLIHQKHWHQGYMWLPEVIQYVWNLVCEKLHTSIGWSIWLPTFLMFFVFLGILLLSSRDLKNPLSLLAFAFCYFVASYSLTWLLSAGRYMSCCFPMFIFLARLTAERPSLKRCLQGVGAVFTGIYLFAYVSGAQVM